MSQTNNISVDEVINELNKSCHENIIKRKNIITDRLKKEMKEMCKKNLVDDDMIMSVIECANVEKEKYEWNDDYIYDKIIVSFGAFTVVRKEMGPDSFPEILLKIINSDDNYVEFSIDNQCKIIEKETVGFFSNVFEKHHSWTHNKLIALTTIILYTFGFKFDSNLLPDSHYRWRENPI
jgi:hypothetical protein